MAVATAAGVLSAIHPGASFGAPPPGGLSCRDEDWIVQGNESEIGANAPVQREIQGLRGEIYVGSSDFCNRVSSISLVDGNSGFGVGLYEFGWVLGYSSCDDQYYSAPRLFIVWTNIGDRRFHCRVLRGIGGPLDVFKAMRAGDVDLDTRFNSYIENSIVDNSQVNLNWTNGYTIASSERSNRNDTAFADFRDMEEHRSGAWSTFENIRLEFDRDPGFYWNRISGSRAQIVAN